MRGLIRTGGWTGFGLAILVGALLPVVVFIGSCDPRKDSNDLKLGDLPWAMAGGALAGALAGGVLLGLDRLGKRGRPGAAPQKPGETP